MARAASKHTPEEWTEIGRNAILDLLADRLVVPWEEAEARISFRGYKDFEPVQPVQLNGARRSLDEEGLIIQESTEHFPPVTTIRLPFQKGQKRKLERLRGKRRKDYRKYISWAQDGSLCGKHAERVVLASAQAAASEAGLWIPPQKVGEIHEVNGIPITRGPLDAFAHILAVPDPRADAALAVEVKNIDWSREQWHVKQLIKCAARRWKVPGGPDKALDVAGCESGFDPKAYANGNAGVFQQRVTYWPGRAKTYGFKGWPALNGRANIIVSIRMAHAGGWSPWSCA